MTRNNCGVKDVNLLTGQVDNQPCPWSPLRTQQSPARIIHSGEQTLRSEGLLNTSRRLMLPPVSGAPRLKVFRFAGLWSGTHCQLPPRWWFKPAHSSEVPRNPGNGLETWRRRLLQLSNQETSDIRVALQDHGQAISPTGPMGCLAGAEGTADPQTTERHWQHGMSLVSPMRSTWRMELKHSIMFWSCLLANLLPPLGRYTAMNVSPWTPRNEPTRARLLARHRSWDPAQKSLVVHGQRTKIGERILGCPKSSCLAPHGHSWTPPHTGEWIPFPCRSLQQVACSRP